MTVECALSIVVPIIKGKSDERNSSCRSHGHKVVEKELEERLHRIVIRNEMQVCFMPM